MTFSAMRTEVLRRLGENPSTPVWYTAAEAGEALNEAHRLFALAALSVEKTATIALPAATPILASRPLLAAMLAPLRIYTAAGSRVRPASLETLAGRDSRFLNAEDEPRFYALVGGLLIVTPQPAAPLDLSVTYAASPTDMAADSSTPEIPDEDHGALIERAFYTLVSVKEGASRRTEAEPAQQAFVRAVEARAALVRSRALSMDYDTQPFELGRYFNGR